MDLLLYGEKSVDPDQPASDEASWSGSTLFSKDGNESWNYDACIALIINMVGENKRKKPKASLLIIMGSSCKTNMNKNMNKVNKGTISLLIMRVFHLKQLSLHKYLFLLHCQMNANPWSNQEIHMLCEHGYKLDIYKSSPELFAWRYTESVADQTDQFVPQKHSAIILTCIKHLLVLKQWIITQQFTHWSWFISIVKHSKRRKHIRSLQLLPTFRHCTEELRPILRLRRIPLHLIVTSFKRKNDVTPSNAMSDVIF